MSRLKLLLRILLLYCLIGKQTIIQLRVLAYGEPLWYMCAVHVHGQKFNPLKLP